MTNNAIKGRGTPSKPVGRFESRSTDAVDDGWGLSDEALPPVETVVAAEPAKTIISRNDSPDIGFDQSVNPFRGCEHACIYCYARPSHSYINLSPGLDFETKLFYKKDAAKLLDKELRAPRYVVSPINLGANTDPYQPIERDLRVTRSIIEVLRSFRHPLTIVTKGSLIERDIDILSELAADNLVAVYVSLTTLSSDLKRVMEPRAASPKARLRVIRSLAEAKIPVGVFASPMIPFINDHELEGILEQARDAGATTANYILVRLPHEVKDLFAEWLETHFPAKAKHVMSLIYQARDGKANDPQFGSRMRGTGQYSEMLRSRFQLASKRYGFDVGRGHRLDTSLFRIPPAPGDQLSMFPM